MQGLRAMWDRGQLAVIQGVGYPNPDRSHFEAMDIWQSADLKRLTTTGWLGRATGGIKNSAGGVPILHIGGDRLPVAVTGSAGFPCGQRERPLPRGPAGQTDYTSAETSAHSSPAQRWVCRRAGDVSNARCGQRRDTRCRQRLRGKRRRRSVRLTSRLTVDLVNVMIVGWIETCCRHLHCRVVSCPGDGRGRIRSQCPARSRGRKARAGRAPRDRAGAGRGRSGPV
jgi:hypothetical protein